MIVEIITMGLGLLQGWLVLINKRSNWVAYCLQMVFMFIFSLNANLYGDMIGAGIYFFYGIIGYLLWGGVDNKITEINWKERIIYLLVFVVGVLIFYKRLLLTNDPLPLIDSMTTVSSFIATYYMVRRKLETWVIWFFCDILYCIQYFILERQGTYLMVLNIIWTFMAIFSYINWKKIMRSYV